MSAYQFRLVGARDPGAARRLYELYQQGYWGREIAQAATGLIFSGDADRFKVLRARMMTRGGLTTVVSEEKMQWLIDAPHVVIGEAGCTSRERPEVGVEWAAACCCILPEDREDADPVYPCVQSTDYIYDEAVLRDMAESRHATTALVDFFIVAEAFQGKNLGPEVFNQTLQSIVTDVNATRQHQIERFVGEVYGITGIQVGVDGKEDVYRFKDYGGFNITNMMSLAANRTNRLCPSVRYAKLFDQRLETDVTYEDKPVQLVADRFMLVHQVKDFVFEDADA